VVTSSTTEARAGIRHARSRRHQELISLSNDNGAWVIGQVVSIMVVSKSLCSWFDGGGGGKDQD